MSNNQTIDGVSRELLEASWAALMQKGQVINALKLRDLLDAAAPTPVPAGWIRFDDDQKAIFTRGKRSNDSEPLYLHPTAYRMPVAQQQGEPVAELQVAFFEHGPMATINWFTPSAFEPGATKLYAKQPAPVVIEHYKNKVKHLKQLLRNVRATLHFSPEDVLAIDAALREDEE